MTESGKQYGLLVPKKSTQILQPRLSIFGDDSESDSGEGGNWVGRAFKNESVQKRQTKLDIKKALEQDPTVYQYDEVYDEMEEKKMEQKMKKKDPEKRPKYIQALLATAERRKREQERRTERKVQKEREAEGEEFKDKESFVTSAYRKKLEEFQAMDEQERMEDRIEELTDVAKQKDLSGFYRHLYRQKVCDKDHPEPPTMKTKEENNAEKNNKQDGCVPEKLGKLTLTPEGSGGGLEMSKVEERQYRKRKVSSSSESANEKDGEEKKSKAEEVSDGDSDSSSSESSSGSSSDSSSSSEGSGDEDQDDKSKPEGENAVKVKRKENEEQKSDKESSESKKKSDPENMTGGDVEQKAKEGNIAPGGKVTDEKVPEEPKPNIWEKITVGPVFEEALQRYLARKAAKTAGLRFGENHF